MLISELAIIHLESSDPVARAALKAVLHGGDFLYVETCLRTFVVGTIESLSQVEQGLLCLDIFEGQEAYEWLLVTACGLRSKVLGETEVFSQVKEAWQIFERTKTEFVKDLRPWMKRLYIDVKLIRSEFLQGTGAVSYGSLARKMLTPTEGENVVFIGAGQLAETVAPYFLKSQVTIYNRSAPRLEKIKVTLARSASIREICFTIDAAELGRRLTRANHVIICTPAHDALETAWAEQLALTVPLCQILHLGTTEEAPERWQKMPNTRTLFHLFLLQSEQNELKTMRVKKALLACEEKAQNRALMDAITMNHGWEDLTGFS